MMATTPVAQSSGNTDLKSPLTQVTVQPVVVHETPLVMQSVSLPSEHGNSALGESSTAVHPEKSVIQPMSIITNPSVITRTPVRLF